MSSFVKRMDHKRGGAAPDSGRSPQKPRENDPVTARSSGRVGSDGRTVAASEPGQGALAKIKNSLPRVATALAAIESLDFQPFRRRQKPDQRGPERAKDGEGARSGSSSNRKAEPQLYAEPEFPVAARSPLDRVGEAPASFPTTFAPASPVGHPAFADPAVRSPVEDRSELVPESAGEVRRLDRGAADAGKGRKPPWLFLAMVGLPVLVTGIYLFGFAADRYTSEASYIISKGGAALIGGAIPGLGRSDESSEAIAVFFKSRDAAEHLAQDADLKAKLMHPSADFLSGYPGAFYDETNEGLFEAMRNAVEMEIDSSTGISTLKVTSFTPNDSKELAEALLKEAEALINRMNERATADAISFATTVLAESEDRARDIQKRMTSFRNTESLLDPSVQSAAQIELMTTLSQQVMEVDTEIAQLRASAAKNPRLNSLAEQRNALNNQVEQIRLSLAGSDSSLAPKLSAYEDLTLERDLAIQALTHAYLSLEEARQEAFANRLYLQTISVPNLPDRPSFPQPFFWMAVVAALSYALYRTMRTTITEAMEHSA